MEMLYPIPPRRVADIPLRLRPRELFDRLGAEHVSEEILLALLLRCGMRGMNVLDLAHNLLLEYGSLTALSQAPVQELTKKKGIGPVKAQILRAALELGRRLGEEAAPERPLIRTPEDAARVLRGRASSRETEAFWVLLLDTKNRLRREPVEISSGLLNASLAHPREVFKEAIRCLSAAVVLVHNHPSGDPAPSAEDVKITRQLVEAGKIVDIPVLDHIILGRSAETGDKDYYSLRESGVVSFEDKT
jgi:DNA repair protein RadC